MTVLFVCLHGSAKSLIATRAVSLGCEQPVSASATVREQWDGLPLVSDGFARARDAIVQRVTRLVDALSEELG